MSKWAWMLSGDEVAHGTYATREEAIAEAEAHFEGLGEHTIELGKPDHPDPSYFAAHVIDAEDLVERMDEVLFEGLGDFYSGDASMFELRPGAQEALKSVVSQWASKWVKRVGPWTLRESGDTVVVGAQAEAPNDRGGP